MVFVVAKCSPTRQPEDKHPAPPTKTIQCASNQQRSASRAITAEDEMEVTHNNKQYKAVPMANGSLWRLTSLERPRESVVLNRSQMIIAGLGHVVESQVLDLNKVRAAQNKIVIALFLEDDRMWKEAVEQYRLASGRTLH
ncbi:host cell division inhibitory peptide Kil [Atlantibacter hermannii]|uniref:host cell division inhibitory peptide Kil n=1 Tax=Atlantibacter hermannii TaxID=565 RepID=UPI0028AB049C|nr:hypothetical protein [Atlantibacter hermannii]